MVDVLEEVTNAIPKELAIEGIQRSPHKSGYSFQSHTVSSPTEDIVSIETRDKI